MTDEEEVDAWIKFMDKSVTVYDQKGIDDPWSMTMPTVEKVTLGSLPVILLAGLVVFMALKK